MTDLPAPFPWFGGKSRAASLIWSRFGEVDNYVEPFAGSLAVLLSSPKIARTETVNDLDGFIANAWRAMALRPDETADAADWPVNENDLHARHAWLVEQRPTLTARLEGDPSYCDPLIAGWWIWGACCWIGSGWCARNGPWVRRDGMLIREPGAAGVHRQLPHLGNYGVGVHRQLPSIGDYGRGVHRKVVSLHEWFSALSSRLRRVRVCCGDWRRVLGPSPTVVLGTTAVLLDPPYSEGEREMDCYAVDSGTVAADVRQWALGHGDDRRMRIALCGYDTEHDMPGWTTGTWIYKGGYGNERKSGANENRHRETVWFSPGCLGRTGQTSLF